MTDDTKQFRKTKASYEKILVDAGFAALVLLKRTNARGTTYFFASARTDDEGVVSSYFVVMVSKETTLDYFLGRSDLHYVYVYAPNATYYEADAASIFEKEIELRPFSGQVNDDWIPSKGFFARDHNRQYEFIKQPPCIHEIAIDGQWKMGEFQEFYSRYSDIYVFQEAVRTVKNLAIDSVPVNYLSAFRGKPFRGGSSYVSFFNDLKDALPFHERPQLAAVKWASPGEISVKGTKELFDAVEGQVISFQRDYDKSKDAHDRLREFMQVKGWLEITSESYPTPSADETTEISGMIKSLAAYLHVPGGRSFVHILEGNQIVEAKIFLAVFRRLETILRYVREGRVSIGS